MATSPLLSPQYARAGPSLPRRVLPPPPAVASPATAERLRLLVRRAPPPAQAKFGKFDAADAPVEAEAPAVAPLEADGAAEQAAVEEDDSCLPSDLQGAISQSGKASADFVNSGGMRGIAELLIPQLEFLNEEGAQAEVWALSRILLDTLAQETGQKVKAIFPDAGVAALLKYQWKDAQFKCASLSDRKPVDTDDGVVVMIIPDHQMLEAVERIASQLADDPIRPLVMWNPRLISGDVGVGYNVRNLRRNFLSTFTTVYSMRPLPTGAIFRCYPEYVNICSFFHSLSTPSWHREVGGSSGRRLCVYIVTRCECLPAASRTVALLSVCGVWSFPSCPRSGVAFVAEEVVKACRVCSSASASSAGRGGEGWSWRLWAARFGCWLCRCSSSTCVLWPASVARGAASGGGWVLLEVDLVGAEAAGRRVVAGSSRCGRVLSTRSSSVAWRRTAHAADYKVWRRSSPGGKRKWKVFYDDPKRPNRYLLARESSSRPDATDIEIIFGGGGASEQSEEEPSMMSNVVAAFSSVSRFMRAISK